MRWLLGSLAILLFVAAIAALIAPRLVEWNAYRGRIAEALAQRTGLEARIDGDLHLVLLPTPTLFAGDVRLSSAATPDRTLATLEGLRAELAPLPLLLGEVEPRTITLESPEIALRLDRESQTTAAALAGRLLATAEPGADSRLQTLSIADGRIELLDGERQVASFAGIDLALAMPGAGRQGELQVAGRWNAVPFSAQVEIGGLPPAGTTSLRVRAELAGGLAQIGYGGSLAIDRGEPAPAAPKVATEGTLSATLRDPAALLSLLHPQGDDMRALSGEPLALGGRVIAESGSLVLNDLDLRWGRTTASGAVAALLGPPLDLNLTLHVAGLDLDRLMPLAAGLVPASQADFALPGGGRVTFDLSATALHYRDSVVREVQLAGVLDDGVLDLQGLRADLPGSAAVSATGRLQSPGTLPEFTGHVTFDAADARRTLAWLGIAEEMLPPGGPRRLRIDSDLALDSGLWRVIDLAAAMDGAELHGGIALRPVGRPSFSANLRLDNLDLNPWLPVASRWIAGLSTDQARPVGQRLAALGGLLAAADSNLRLGLRNLRWDENLLTEANVDLTLVRGELSLTRAVAMLGDGLRAELSGTATAGEDDESLDYDLELEAAGRQLLDQMHRLAPVLFPGAGGGDKAASDKALGSPFEQPISGPGADPGTGPSRLFLRVSGDSGQALLRDIEIHLPGARLNGRATLGLLAPVPTLVADLGWQVHHPQRFGARFADRFGGAGLAPYRLPSTGRAAFTVDAGTIAVNDLTVSLPSIALTGRARISRTARPTAFDFAAGVQADSPAVLLDAIGLPAAGEPLPAMPVALVVQADGTSDTVRLEKAELAVGAAALRLTGTGRLQPEPALSGDLELVAPDLGQVLRQGGIAPAGDGGPLGPVSVTGSYQAGDDALRIEGLDGRAGPAELVAALALDWTGGRPELLVDIGLSGLPLDRLLPRDAGTLLTLFLASPADTARHARPGAEGIGDLIASAERLAERLSVDLALSAEEISAGDGLFGEGRLEVQLRDRELLLKVLEGRLADGRLAATGRLDSRGLPALSLQMDMEAVEASALVAALTGRRGLSGRTDARLRLRTAGATPEAMLDRLSGQADIRMRDGRMAGIDLAALAAMVGREPPRAPEEAALRAALVGPLSGDSAAAGTAFDSLTGLLFVESGVLRLQHVEAAMAGGSAAWHGSVNLPAAQLDLTGTLRLSAPPEAPAVEVEIEGPFGDLQRRALVDAMRQYLVGLETAARIAAPAPAVPRHPGPAGASRTESQAEPQDGPGAEQPVVGGAQRSGASPADAGKPRVEGSVDAPANRPGIADPIGTGRAGRDTGPTPPASVPPRTGTSERRSGAGPDG